MGPAGVVTPVVLAENVVAVGIAGPAFAPDELYAVTCNDGT